MDILDPAGRSRRMASIRQKDTYPEVALRKQLHALGLRYVLNSPGLPGRPDIAFPRYRVVVFVHGCFWHGHSCRAGRLPSTRPEYWHPKIEANRRRDRRKARELRELGWSVITVWQCEIRTETLLKRKALSIAKRIRQRGLR